MPCLHRTHPLFKPNLWEKRISFSILYDDMLFKKGKREILLTSLILVASAISFSFFFLFVLACAYATAKRRPSYGLLLSCSTARTASSFMALQKKRLDRWQWMEYTTYRCKYIQKSIESTVTRASSKHTIWQRQIREGLPIPYHLLGNIAWADQRRWKAFQVDPICEASMYTYHGVRHHTQSHKNQTVLIYIRIKQNSSHNILAWLYMEDYEQIGSSSAAPNRKISWWHPCSRWISDGLHNCASKRASFTPFWIKSSTAKIAIQRYRLGSASTDSDSMYGHSHQPVTFDTPLVIQSIIHPVYQQK